MCHNLCFREHEFGWWHTQWFMLFLYSTFEFFHPPPPSSTPTLIHVYQSFPLRWQSLPVRSLPALADIKLPYNVLCLIVVFLSLIIRETQSTASVLKQEATALFQVFTLQMTLFDSHIFFSSDQTNDSKSNKNQNVEHIILLRCHLNSIWVLHYTCLNPPPAISILKSLHSHWRLSLQYQNQPKNLNAWKLILKGNEQM